MRAEEVIKGFVDEFVSVHGNDVYPAHLHHLMDGIVNLNELTEEQERFLRTSLFDTSADDASDSDCAFWNENGYWIMNEFGVIILPAGFTFLISLATWVNSLK